MEISTPAPPRTVQLSRNRLLGVVVTAAAAAAAITGVVVALTVGGSTTSAKPALSPQVQAAVNNVPLIPAIKGAHVVPVSPDAAYVQSILSLTPSELVAAFGTDEHAAAVLASLTPAERQHVKSITALTPEQLRAAFGTGSNGQSYKSSVLASLTPNEQRYVESIMALTPAELRAAFGTGKVT